jgi:hypothetical protein
MRDAQPGLCLEVDQVITIYIREKNMYIPSRNAWCAAGALFNGGGPDQSKLIVSWKGVMLPVMTLIKSISLAHVT